MAGELLVLAVMTLFGLATAGFLAFMVRDLVERLATGPAERATRLATAGAAVYLVGFLLVLAGVVSAGSDGGVGLVDLGIAVIVLAAAPMAAGLYLAARGG